MIFNSLIYLLFLPTVLILLKIFGDKGKLAVLLLASYVFYMWWNPSLIVLILAATAVSYFCAVGIEKSRSKSTRKAFLFLSLAALIGMLVFFKYFNFLAELFSDAAGVFGISMKPVSFDIILPVGISFYTFQTLSYVIDVYRGSIPAEHNFGYYALYVSFFPQLVAGPIERPENLMPQLKNSVVFTSENILAGLYTMSVGYFKKIAAADILAGYVNSVYNSPEGKSGTSVIIATLLFTVQIYCDFSGYSDIAIGTARLMEIKLMKNFDRPYSASSVKEFWDRWHISLSSWLRDYLYFSLGGSRKGKARTQLNIIVVFLVSGLWHGADLTFVLWGLIHCAARVVENLLYPLRKKITEAVKVSRICSSLVSGTYKVVTFVFISFTWLFFRANSIGDTSVLLNSVMHSTSLSIESLDSAVQGMGMAQADVVLTISVAVVLFLTDKIRPREEDGVFVTAKMFWLAICAALLLASRGGASSFIYFRF